MKSFSSMLTIMFLFGPVFWQNKYCFCRYMLTVSWCLGDRNVVTSLWQTGSLQIDYPLLILNCPYFGLVLICLLLISFICRKKLLSLLSFAEITAVFTSSCPGWVDQLRHEIFFTDLLLSRSEVDGVSGRKNMSCPFWAICSPLVPIWHSAFSCGSL